MPCCFKFERFTVYFWSNEGFEPIHVHVSEGSPTPHATKFWLTRDGGAELAHNGSGYTDKELKKLCRVIIANHSLIVDCWTERFGIPSYRHGLKH